MEKFYLEIPSLKRKEAIIAYLNEFVLYNSDINGSGFLDKILEGYSFEECLDKCLNMQYQEYAKKLNRLQSKTFLLIRKNDNKLIGMLNIRWNIPPNIQEFVGNIGYGIRPTERKKGYNKINLYLGLIEIQKLCLKKIYLDCEDNNIASYKTMEALNAKLLSTKIDPYDNLLTRIYSIDVNKTINKYRSTYQKYIL